jgi:glyoxylase-like metal-dependent hydrolase (beta-lactamase superfamily II)
MTKANIFIDTIPVGEIETNCYLIGDGKEAILIDPGEEAERIESLIKKRGVKIGRILLTHGHMDHIGAVSPLKKLTGAPVLIHSKDAIMLTDPKANLSGAFGNPFVADAADGFLEDGDEIMAGDLILKVIYTPGHTPGGVSLYGANAGVVFTGDALFAGSIGRTDFPRSNYQMLINSIKQRLFVLPDKTIVYPGHGPQTTIGEEKSSNPWLS